MIIPLKIIPMYINKIPDWESKKSKIISVMNADTWRPDLNGLGEFSTDRTKDGSQISYFEDFMQIFSEDINSMGTELELESLQIKNLWSVTYETGDFHPVHTHGKTHYSAVIYFDYDPEEHTPTYFVTDNIHHISQNSDIISQNVTEGTICVFPSNILHFTLPNKSKKNRRIISFDMDVSQKYPVRY
jgi:hypothetical protein